jgi:CarD family transcriptional regulator
VEKASIGQIEIQFYKIFVEKEKLTLTVPINQQSNLRQISSINQINKCISILKSKPKIKRTMWSRRAQEYDQKINSGKIYELAEVVKDLNKNSDVIADQSYSERQLFEKAYERLKSEFEAVLKISTEEVSKKMDKALGRNQNISEVE